MDPFNLRVEEDKILSLSCLWWLRSQENHGSLVCSFAI